MKLPTLESVKNIDLKDTKTITIIIIVVIVLFAIVYIWQNKKNTEEGFAQYNVNEGDTVVLPDLNSVIVDSINNERNKSLPEALNIVIDDRLNTTSALNTYAKASDLITTNNNLSSNSASLLNTINTMTTLSNRLTSDLAIMNNIISSNVALINSNLSSNVATMTTLVNNAPPPLSVIAYFGSTAPTGWQLCDGLPLIAIDETTVVYRVGGSFRPLNTPNLLGRFILGATKSIGANTNNLTQREVGESGGEESHLLTINEMPSHTHSIFNWNGLPGGNTMGINASSVIGTGWTGNTYNTTYIGGTQPHNNMPPFYTMIYIIKKPLYGGNNYAVQQPSPTFT